MAICPGRALSLQLAARLVDLVCACAVCSLGVLRGGQPVVDGRGAAEAGDKTTRYGAWGQSAAAAGLWQNMGLKQSAYFFFWGPYEFSRRSGCSFGAVVLVMASWVDATRTETSENSKLGCKLHMQRSPRRPTQRCGSAVKCVLSRPRRHTQKLLSRHQRVRRCPSCHTSRGADLPGTLTVDR